MNKKAFFALAVLVLVVLACTFTPVTNPTAQPTAGGGGNGQQIVPTSPSIPDAASSPTVSADTGISVILDYEADPIWGPSDLQRGFSPDPRVVGLGSDGIVDTSATNLACGFTTNAPTFAFDLSGGASEGFLRIYFAPSDAGMDTTLIVHTPNQEWICGDNSSNGNGADPVIDIEYAASGKYAVWVGTQQSGASVLGMLNITESAANIP